MDEAVASKVLPLAKKLANRMKDVLGCDGLNVLQNNGEEAGQTVFHFHMHLIPRYKGGTPILSWGHVKLTEEEILEIRDGLAM